MAQRTPWQSLSWQQQTRVLLFWLVVIALVMGITSSIENGRFQWRSLGGNLATELMGGVLTFFVFQYVLDKRDEDALKSRLIREMGSRDNATTMRAVEELRAHGWLFDGSLQKAGLFRANLQGAELWQANLQQAYLRDANLQGVGLQRANLQQADLRDANLQRARLEGINLQQAKLGKTNLQQADLSETNLQQADLRYSNLQQAWLNRSDLQEAKLWGANLQQAGLNSADLQGAKLLHANLQQTALIMTNLQQADLRGANLQEAILETEFSGTIYKAQFDETTILPDGSRWTPETDMRRFTDPSHPDFWQPDWVKNES